MGELTEDLGFLLARVSGEVVRATNAALAEDGLRVRQYAVLLLACDSRRGVSQRAMARVLGLDPSQVVALVDELAQAGLVERQPAPTDRRAKLVTATEAGYRKRERAAVRAPVGNRARVHRTLAASNDGSSAVRGRSPSSGSPA